MRGAPILSKSNKQHMITKSSREAKLVALCYGITVVIGFRNIFSDLGVELVTSTI